MDALYEKLADAIEKSNKAYDIPRKIGRAHV